jgi:hypothetical protein
MPDRSQSPEIKLAVRAWAAVHRRERSLEPARADFESAVPERIRGDERFQQALEDAQTAGAVQQAVALHEAESKQWAAKGVALLRAIKTADGAYEQELHEALAAYRDSTTGGSEENDTNDQHAH